MTTKYLFPYKLKKISGLIFLISLLAFSMFALFNQDIFSGLNLNFPVFAIAGEGGPVFKTTENLGLLDTYYFSFIYNNIGDEILYIILTVSGIIYAFSREKEEDEMISKIRMDSLAWATIFNYTVLLFCYLLFYGLSFLYILTIAMFSNLLFFIIRFRWMIYNHYKANDEEPS